MTMLRAIIPSSDHRDLRDAYGSFPTGITALATRAGDTLAGMVASSFTSVSLDPPLVSVCIGTASQTLPVLRSSARIGLSVLASTQTDVSRALSRRADRFDGVSWSENEHGAVFIDEASAWLDCELESAIAAGDHEILLLRVHALKVDAAREPLVFHGSRYRQLVTA